MKYLLRVIDAVGAKIFNPKQKYLIIGILYLKQVKNIPLRKLLKTVNYPANYIKSLLEGEISIQEKTLGCLSNFFETDEEYLYKLGRHLYFAFHVDDKLCRIYDKLQLLDNEQQTEIFSALMFKLNR